MRVPPIPSSRFPGRAGSPRTGTCLHPRSRHRWHGRPGLFYFHRQVSYYPGDSGVDSPTCGGDQLEIALPTAALRAGENKLVLTAIDDPRDGPAESVVTYDALRLAQTPEGKAAAERQVEAQPTIFYVQQAGGPRELTLVTSTLDEKARQGKVTLAVGGEKFEADLSPEPRGFTFDF